MSHSFRPVKSRSNIGGHPIHPMLVPLPIGLLSAAVVTDALYAVTRDRFFARASKLLLGAGTVTGLAAAPFGARDFREIPRVHELKDGWIHGLGNLAVLGVSSANLALRTRNETGSILPAGLALSALAAGALAVTGWFGGELSYRYGVGAIPNDGSGDDAEGAIWDQTDLQPRPSIVDATLDDSGVGTAGIADSGDVAALTDPAGATLGDRPGLIGDLDAAPADDAPFENIGGVIRSTSEPADTMDAVGGLGDDPDEFARDQDQRGI